MPPPTTMTTGKLLFCFIGSMSLFMLSDRIDNTSFTQCVMGASAIYFAMMIIIRMKQGKAEDAKFFRQYDEHMPPNGDE